MKERFRTIALAMVLAALCFAVYFPALRHGFVQYDDDLYLTSNVYVKHGITSGGIEYAFTKPVAGNWHPLTMLSLMIDAELWGVPAHEQTPLSADLAKPRRTAPPEIDLAHPRVRFGFHFTSILLHAANAVLLFLLVLRLPLNSLVTLPSTTGSRLTLWPMAFSVAAIFAVHPLHVESVAWISERKDVLFMCFWLIGLHFYVSYARYCTPPEYVFTALAFACSLMSKPMAVTFPFVLLLLDVWPLRRFQLRSHPTAPASSSRFIRRPPLILVAEKVPLLVVAAALSLVTYYVQRVTELPEDGRLIEFHQRLLNGIVSYPRYLWKLIWPVDLAALYPHPSLIADVTWPVWLIAFAFAIVLLFSAIAFWSLRRKAWAFLFTGWFWFLGTLVPVIGLVQVGRQSMADRYAYLPFLGIYLIVVLSAASVVQRFALLARPMCAVGLVVVTVLALRANNQVHVWKDTQTLFAHAVAVTDQNWLMMSNLAAVRRGFANDHAKAGNHADARVELDAAIGHQLQAIQMYPHSARLRAQLAGMLWQKALPLMNPDAQNALFNQAIDHMKTAVSFNPDDPVAHRDLALGYSMIGRQQDARTELEASLLLKPENPDALRNLAIVLAELGEVDLAVDHLAHAIRIDPAKEGEYRMLLENIRTNQKLKNTPPN